LIEHITLRSGDLSTYLQSNDEEKDSEKEENIKRGNVEQV
jgi:hypothetical protein